MFTEKQFDVEMKKKLIEMLAWFHDFCEKNKIRYYVIDGTMLGTARHQGFIPWDDDIDVGIPRKDYEKLINLMHNQKGVKYTLETPYSDAKEFIYTYSKLYDSTTTLIEHARMDIERGIFIDIFPLDGIGNSLEESKQNFKKIDRWFKFYMSRVVALRPGRKFYKNLAVLIAQMIPDFILNNKKIQKRVDKLCQEHDFDDCQYGGNLLGTWRFRDVIDKQIYGKPTLYKFESIYVYGVEHYDVYLKHLYGEWRKLPPIEEQVTHHNFVNCDLNKAYKNE